MASKGIVQYDFSKSQSLKIYPKRKRKTMRDILGESELKTMKALRACESELKYIMDIANTRISMINDLVAKKESAIEDAVKDQQKIVEDIVTENIKAGGHLVDEVFIPEYLGFMEIPPEKEGDVRVYVKDGYSMTRFDNRWLICSPDEVKTLVLLKNMHNAIIILESLGIDVNFEDYLTGKYDSTRKSIEETTYEILGEVVKKRKKEEVFKLSKK